MKEPVKTEKPVKPLKKGKSWHKRVFKVIAYIALMIFASYGLKQLFGTIDENVAYISSSVIVLMIAYIIFED